MIPIWLYLVWAGGCLIHSVIIWKSWWSGRLYWKPCWWCNCGKCEPFRCTCQACNANRRKPDSHSGVHPNKEGSPHSVPHMLELDHAIWLIIAGLFVWWGFLMSEAYDFTFHAREKHLEYLKKRNRPIEEVLKELNAFIDEGTVETEKQVNDFVEKHKDRLKS